MGITLFIKNNVDKKILNYEIATQWILNINAVVIILGAPVLSIYINKLKNRGYNFSTSTQFASVFFILALSFLCLAFAVIFSNSQGISKLFWVILHFVAITIAELLIGPVGYAMVGCIAPIQLQGILMGTWMMVSGVSASLSQYISNKWYTPKQRSSYHQSRLSSCFLSIGNMGISRWNISINY